MITASFLSGGIMVICWFAGLLFLKFWRSNSEPLFLCFCIAFWLFAIERLFLVHLEVQSEPRTYVYLIRLVAFGFILYGIVGKNRTAEKVRSD